ncbi:uncharacterized protein LOC119284031 [Triticum dicoccoides]|uniref:uncharacterized protein LOC119284031 n=1 Tax=Triticum dicoccoides TaxID=85692 RepID=UPI0018908292|nr:uncharacterized protein LOC119284031 [Triticum dicoccoides]
MDVPPSRARAALRTPDSAAIQQGQTQAERPPPLVPFHPGSIPSAFCPLQRLLLCSSIPNPNPGDGAVARGSPFTDGAIWSESALEEHVYVGEAARPARRRSVLPWFLTERHEEEKIMVKEKGNEKGKGAGKENAKAKAKEKSVNYLIRQDSALPN